MLKYAGFSYFSRRTVILEASATTSATTPEPASPSATTPSETSTTTSKSATPSAPPLHKLLVRSSSRRLRFRWWSSRRGGSRCRQRYRVATELKCKPRPDNPAPESLPFTGCTSVAAERNASRARGRARGSTQASSQTRQSVQCSRYACAKLRMLNTCAAARWKSAYTGPANFLDQVIYSPASALRAR